MTAAERASGLAAAARTRREALIALAESIAGRGRLVVVAPPAAAVVEVRLGSVAGDLPVVDAVVTTAAVEVDGRAGWGCVLGWDDRGALAAALCDARSGDEVAALAGGALADEAEFARGQATALAATRVVPG